MMEGVEAPRVKCGVGQSKGVGLRGVYNVREEVNYPFSCLWHENPWTSLALEVPSSLCWWNARCWYAHCLSRTRIGSPALLSVPSGTRSSQRSVRPAERLSPGSSCRRA
ncbi:hypothetical protein FKM82_009843 [Ascaphus truei]